MKATLHSILRAFVRTLVWAGLAMALSSSVFGQSAPPKKSDPVREAQRLEKYRVTMANAKSLAAANNVAAAEQEIVAASEMKPSTAAWHMEIAQRLLQVAESLARGAKPAGIPALANSALLHLNQAELLSRDARAKAAAKSLIGFVQERYLANRTAALANYQAAAQLSPANGRAKEAVERLQRTDDNLRARAPGGGR